MQGEEESKEGKRTQRWSWREHGQSFRKGKCLALPRRTERRETHRRRRRDWVRTGIFWKPNLSQDNVEEAEGIQGPGGWGRICCQPLAWRTHSHTHTHRFWPSWPPESTGPPGKAPPPRATASGRAPSLGEVRPATPAPGWALRPPLPPPRAARAGPVQRAASCSLPRRPPGTKRPPAQRRRRRRLPGAPASQARGACSPQSRFRYLGPDLDSETLPRTTIVGILSSIPSRLIPAPEITQSSPSLSPQIYSFESAPENLPSPGFGVVSDHRPPETACCGRGGGSRGDCRPAASSQPQVPRPRTKPPPCADRRGQYAAALRAAPPNLRPT